MNVVAMDIEKNRWKYMAAAMLLALCSGIGYTWSVFQKPLMENFDWGLKTISLTFTIQVMFSTLAPIFLGKYHKKIGTKKYLRIGLVVYIIGLIATMFTSSITYLYVVYGIIVGIGIAMLYPSLVTYSTSLFPDKTGLASGLIASAYGSGAILWAPIAMFFIKRFGVLSVFGVFAIIFSIVMIPTTFLIKNIPDNYVVTGSTSEKNKKENYLSIPDYTWKEMLRTSKYYVLVIALTLGAVSGLMITGHASPMLQEIQGFTAETAAVLVGLFSVFNAMGRLLFGYISDRLGRYNVMMILFTVIGVLMIMLTKLNGTLFVAALMIISSCYGGFTSMFSPVCADNFGLKNLSVNYAFLYIAYGFAGAIGPQIAARVKIISGGYNMAFQIVAGMSLIGLLLINYLKMKSVKPKVKAVAIS